jgi:hypothetical protein
MTAAQKLLITIIIQRQKKRKPKPIAIKVFKNGEYIIQSFR